jgi:hypothetical protein
LLEGKQQQQQQQQTLLEGKQQQQQRLQQLGSKGWAQQEAWEVLTATDSDDEEDDALSLGGSSDGGSSDGGSSDGGSNGTGNNDGAERGTTGGAGGFYDSYSAALEAELAATTMAQTFEKVQIAEPAAAADGKASAGAPAAAAAVAAAAAGSGPSGEAGDAGLTPLDVDYNLVKSLLASYTAQGGLPGPASNLAGLLGLQLPTDESQGPSAEQ